jgi:hypothetical protein
LADPSQDAAADRNGQTMEMEEQIGIQSQQEG